MLTSRAGALLSTEELNFLCAVAQPQVEQTDTTVAKMSSRLLQNLGRLPLRLER